MKITDSFDYKGNHGFYEECYFEVSTYKYTGNKCLEIYNEEDGPVTICTVNAKRICKDDEIGIKNYFECEGMVDFLKGIGIIDGNPVAVEKSGAIEIPYYKLTKSGMELFAVDEM